MKYETNTLPRGDSTKKIIASQGSFTLVYTFRLPFVTEFTRANSVKKTQSRFCACKRF